MNSSCMLAQYVVSWESLWQASSPNKGTVCKIECRPEMSDLIKAVACNSAYDLANNVPPYFPGFDGYWYDLASFHKSVFHRSKSLFLMLTVSSPPPSFPVFFSLSLPPSFTVFSLPGIAPSAMVFTTEVLPWYWPASPSSSLRPFSPLSFTESSRRPSPSAQKRITTYATTKTAKSRTPCPCFV